MPSSDRPCSRLTRTPKFEIQHSGRIAATLAPFGERPARRCDLKGLARLRGETFTRQNERPSEDQPAAVRGLTPRSRRQGDKRLGCAWQTNGPYARKPLHVGVDGHGEACGSSELSFCSWSAEMQRSQPTARWLGRAEHLALAQLHLHRRLNM